MGESGIPAVPNRGMGILLRIVTFRSVIPAVRDAQWYLSPIGSSFRGV